MLLLPEGEKAGMRGIGLRQILEPSPRSWEREPSVVAGLKIKCVAIAGQYNVAYNGRIFIRYSPFDRLRANGFDWTGIRNTYLVLTRRY